MNKGDKVQLVSGSRVMTIAWIEQNEALCIFWVDSTAQMMREKIPVEALVKVEK